MIEQAYEKLKAVPILPMNGNKLMVLDLDSLPVKPIPMKEIFLKWALMANESRMMKGEEPIFPYKLVKACPLWKLISAPIKTLVPTQEGLFNKPGIKTVSQQAKIKSINKS